MTIAQTAVDRILESETASSSFTLDVTKPLSAAMVATISAACDRVEDDREGARFVLYLQGGSTRHADVSWPGEQASLQLVNSWERVLRRLEQFSHPTFGAADGWCNSAALEVLLCCDFRIATAGMCVRREPRNLAWPGMFVYRLAKELGIAKARSLLRAKEIPAHDAASLGLVEIVTSNLDECVEQLVRGCNAPAVSTMRTLLSESFATTYENAIGIHLAACDKFIRSRRER